MAVRRISPAEVAVYRGEEFEPQGRPPGMVELYRDGDSHGTVPITDLEEWYTVRTFGMVLDHEFELVEEDGDRYHLWFAGGDGRWMEQAWEDRAGSPDVTFDRVDQISFRGTALKHAVTGTREERTDTLAAWRRRQEERKHES